MTRLALLFTLLSLAFLLLIPTASAGGWAVVTLDTLPTALVAGEPVTISMTVRQHGRTLWDCGDCVRVRAELSAGEDILQPAARVSPGHYTAELTFPRAGEWRWSVASGLFPQWQTMPTLHVAAPATDADVSAPAPAANSLTTPTLAQMWPTLALLSLGILGLVGSATGLLTGLRTHR